MVNERTPCFSRALSSKYGRVASFRAIRWMPHKKGQLKIQQMAFMLLAVTLLFTLVGMFVLIVKFSGLKDDATDLAEKNAMLLVTKLANSPEFSCGESFGSGKIHCVDADKAMVLRESIEKYGGFWDVSQIEIRTIYPKGPERVCTMGNYPNCNTIRIVSDEVKGYYGGWSFVALCRKDLFEGEVYDKCELAKLMVSYEIK